MRKTLLKLFSPPHFDDDEKNRMAVLSHITILAVSTIAFLIGLVDALSGVYATLAAASVLLLPMAVAFWANRRGHLRAASYILILGSVAALTLILSVGQGIHDIGIINYGLILIVASYLLKRQGILVVTPAIILSVAVVVFGEMAGLLPVQVEPGKFEPRLADFLIVALIIIVSAIAIFLLSQALNAALAKSQTSELRWRSLIESIPDVVAILDRNGVIQSLNCTTPEMSTFYIGKSVFEVLAHERGNFSQTELDYVLAGNTLTNEVELLSKGGVVRWYSVSLGPIRQADGRTGGVIAVVRDIQEKKDAEAELRQSRETLYKQTRQLETLQQISQKISALNDLQSTLQRVLEQIQAVLPLDGFVLVLYDRATNMLSFPLIYDEGRIYQEAARPFFPESVFAEAILTRKPHILSRTEEQLSKNLVSSQERMGTKKPSASILTVPMIVHDQVIGALSAHSYAINAYTSENISVLSGAANQVAIAIENARLYEISRARAKQLATLNEIGRSISTLRDLNGVLESAYHLLSHVLELNAFYIALYHAEDQTISYPIVIDDGEKWNEEPTPLIPTAQLTKTIQTGEPYLVNRRWEEIARRQANPAAQNPIGDASKVSASIMIAPLQFGGKVLGAISTQSYKINAYSSDDLELLSGVATQVAIAIENARLYTALQKELAERKRAEAEVRALNIGLETRVRQRTAELEAANQELASFTYTVSHDLRAPIRGIHGLSHIVIEEFKQALPLEAITYIQRVQDNARQMGRLIDELLAFTHLGGQPVRKTTLDMEAPTHAVIGELMKNETRSIAVSVQRLPHAYGDVLLIRQVLTNLLANAIKFTGRKESPQVEIGSLPQNDETVYFVRDNGAGFDMTYAEKLFGVFERLHRQDEFEGSGVGLATVKRIINKHGGRVWAEGKVNEGATVFFTLPAEPEK